MANELDELEKFLNNSNISNTEENGVVNGSSVSYRTRLNFHV